MNFLLITLSLLLHNALVQDTTAPLRSKVYVVDIKANPTSSSGYLQAINDSAISIIATPLHYGTSAEGKLVSYSAINSVSFYRKGSTGRGVLYGALAGAVLGGIFGAVAYSSSGGGGFLFRTMGSFIALFSGLGGLIGVLTGGLIGSKEHHYTINKNKERFDNMRSQMMKVYGVNKPNNKDLTQ